ncbi:hypothetical protein L7F22_064476, partial [Adiantum nelumboides]|nr:hypothetical protein [Adiantum nelumboides]
MDKGCKSLWWARAAVSAQEVVVRDIMLATMPPRVDEQRAPQARHGGLTGRV